MVYNLHSIGMSLIQNSGQDGCQVKPAKGVKNSTAGSLNTACSSSLNNPAGYQYSVSTNRIACVGPMSTNQNHDGDTYVSLMSSFEESREETKHKRRKRIKHSGIVELQDSSDDGFDYSLDLTTSLSTAVGEHLNTSNNSLANKSLASTDSGLVLNENTFVCSILNCAAQFSSELRLEDHMELFKHSPCNPCLLARNCKLPTIPMCYMCPDCDREFSTQDECKDHIKRYNHLTFYPPLAIKAYMCSQCLYLFPDLESCWHHMENASHFGIYYPFANDYSTEEKLGGPVAVADELVQDLISKCGKVVYTVQCLECGMPMETPAILKHHMRETQDQHIVAALTETSLVEVFSTYLASYSCNVCHRLFTGELKELAKHQCAQRFVGTLTENDTRSFAEFIKRCALTVIKSLEPDNIPGPSRSPLRSSAVHNRKSRRLDSSHDAATEIPSKISGQKKKEEKSSHSDSEDRIGTSNELNGKHGTSQKDRKIPLYDYEDPAILESSLAVPLPISSGKDRTDKFKRKQENEENNTKREAEAVIEIADSDEGSDEIEDDFPPGSGAKRKRTAKVSGKSKEQLKSPGLPSDPIIILASPEVTKPNSNKGPESPYFALNYKPKTSCLDTVLTQGHDVQSSENHTGMSAVPVLTDKSNHDQPQTIDHSVRYKLRNREVSATVTTADIPNNIPGQSDGYPGRSDGLPGISDGYSGRSDGHPGRSDGHPGRSDDGFKNIAQNLMQAAGITGCTDDGPRLGLRFEGPQLCQRDRSRTPLENLTPYVPFSNAASSGCNFTSQQSSIYTPGLTNQPQCDPYLGTHIVTGRIRPICQPQIAGPSQYQLRNQYSTAVVPPLLSLPLACPLPQSSVQNQFYRMQGGNVLLQQNFVRPSSSNSKVYSSASQISISKSNSNTPRKPSNVSSVTTEYLQRMKNIVFLDLDNWPSFFHKLPCCLPDFTFVWGFFGGKNQWFEPNGVTIFRQMKQKGLFHLNERCGTTKDAADFAIVLTVGKMDEKLPTDIAFTIMSGDKGFCEVERQMKDSERKVMVVNPHTAAQFSNDMIFALVTSVTDT